MLQRQPLSFCHCTAVLRRRQINPFFASSTHQILAGFWNGSDVHWLPLNNVDEASFSYSDATDDMDPPVWHSERHTVKHCRGKISIRILTDCSQQLSACVYHILNSNLYCGFTLNVTNLLSVVVFKAPPRKLQRQHSWKTQRCRWIKLRQRGKWRTVADIRSLIFVFV